MAKKKKTKKVKAKKRTKTTKRVKKDSVAIWKFDSAHKKPIYYLGIIGTIFSNPIMWIIAGILLYSDSTNKAFKGESIWHAKHMKTNAQKFFYIIGWFAAVGIVLAIFATFGFFMAGFGL